MFTHKYIVKPDGDVLLYLYDWVIAGGAEGIYVWESQLCSHKCEDCSNQGREESQGEVRSLLHVAWKWHANHQDVEAGAWVA